MFFNKSKKDLPQQVSNKEAYEKEIKELKDKILSLELSLKERDREIKRLEKFELILDKNEGHCNQFYSIVEMRILDNLLESTVGFVEQPTMQKAFNLKGLIQEVETNRKTVEMFDYFWSRDKKERSKETSQ